MLFVRDAERAICHAAVQREASRLIAAGLETLTAHEYDREVCSVLPTQPTPGLPLTRTSTLLPYAAPAFHHAPPALPLWLRRGAVPGARARPPRQMHFVDDQDAALTIQYLLVVDTLNFCFWPDGAPPPLRIPPSAHPAFRFRPPSTPPCVAGG